MQIKDFQMLATLGFIVFFCGCSTQGAERKDPFSQYAQAKGGKAQGTRSARKQQAAPGDGNFRVSVSANGAPVKDFNEQLIHRVIVNKKDLVLLSTSSVAGSVPFTGKSERDHFGEIAGVRLTEIRTAKVLPTLGLQDGDLLTAVGKKHTTSLDDLKQLAIDLIAGSATEKRASLTLIRRGRPHKILYSLN